MVRNTVYSERTVEVKLCNTTLIERSDWPTPIPAVQVA